MNKKKQLMKNTIIIFFGKVCTQLLSLLLLPLYTGYLATSEYGLVDLIQTYVTLLVPIITMELEMSIFRFLIDTRGKEKDTKKLISNNFFVLNLCLLIFIIGYLIFICFVDIPFKWIILIDIIVCEYSSILLQIARGFGKTMDFSISCILTGATTIISNIVLIVFLGYKADGMIISMALANAICSIYLFVKLKLYKMIDYKLVDFKLIKDMFKYSLPLVPNGIGWWVINVSDRSIISFVMGASFNGIYAISNKFPTIISSLTGIFNLSWSESAALHIDSSDRDSFFSDIFNTIFKLFTALSVGMIACLPFVFPIMIDKSYNGAYDYIPYLVIGAFFNVGICFYSQIYLAKKLSKQVATTAIMGAIINIIINVCLIKFIGLYAASISTMLSYAAMFIYRFIDIKKYINITIEKGLIIKSLLAFIFAITLYYSHNLILNIINLVVIVIYSFMSNKDFLIGSLNTVLKKIKR